MELSGNRHRSWSTVKHCRSTLTNVSSLQSKKDRRRAQLPISHGLTSAVFSGNIPTDPAGAGIFFHSGLTNIYVTNPTATGWGDTFGEVPEIPVVRVRVDSTEGFYGNGAGLTNLQITSLPAQVVTNGGTATFTTISGDGSGLTLDMDNGLVNNAQSYGFASVGGVTNITIKFVMAAPYGTNIIYMETTAVTNGEAVVTNRIPFFIL